MAATERWLRDGKKRHTEGDLAAAEPLYRRLLGETPRHAEALYLLGTLLIQTRRYAEAATLLERALAAGTTKVMGTWNNLGIALREQGQPGAAIAGYDQALAIDPDYVEALNNRGVALYDLKRAEEAKTCYRRVLELQPDYVQAMNNLSLILRDEKYLDEAHTYLERALAIDPDYVEGLNNLGLIWQARRDFEKALPWHERAVALRPDDPEAINNLGVNHMNLMQSAEAIACFERALALKPAYAEAMNNIGSVYMEQDRPEEAMIHYERALALRQNYAAAHWNKGIAQLIMGDFENGWRGYEWRFEEDKAQKRMFATPYRTDVPTWEGESLVGKTLWVRCEQGAGDMFQYARFLPALKDRGARVIFECPGGLHPVLQDCAGIDQLIGEVPADAPPPAGCDLQIYAMSLTHRLGVTPDNLPREPYIAADPDRCAQWRQHLDRIQTDAHLPFDNLKVGIVWAGNPTHFNDHNRSASLADFAPLASVPGVTLFSLQKGHAALQAETPPEGMVLVNLGRALQNFADTLAVIAHLDLVIAVDTSVVHLAGAMGCPVWTLLPFHPDWRWMLDRADSPWYPSMRLVRQPTPRDWASVMAQVRQALTDLVANSGDREAVEEAEYLFDVGAREEAKARLQGLAAQPRPAVRALNDLGVIFWQEGQREEALGLFLQALQVNPRDRTTILNCADALRAFGQEEEARAILSAIAVTTPAFKIAA